jgi:hypothetical protein
MSIRDDLRGANRALLKPYAGAGSSPARRFAPIIVAAVVGLLCLPYGFFYALTTPWMLVPFVVPPTILLLLVIWAAPASKTIPLGPMERLFFALFIGFVVWPNYLAITLPGLPWITVNRLISTPLTLMFLLSLSSNVQFRKDIGQVLSATPGFWKAFLVLTAMEVITLPLSNHIGATISGLVVLQTTQAMPFFLGCYLFTRPGRATYLLYTLWVLTLILCGIALLESDVHHTLWAGHIPSFLQIPSDLVARILQGGARYTTGQYRLQAVFTGPLGLSEYLGIVTPFVLHLALSRTSKVVVRLTAGATLPLILFIILGTDSRFGLLVSFLSAMLYLLAWALVHRRRAHSLLGTAVVMAYPAVFSIGVLASIFIHRIRAKVWGTGQYNDSTQARYDQLHLALPKMLTHPLGFGVGRGAEAIGYYTEAGQLSVDSFYLMLVMDLGFIGLISFLTMFVYLIWKSAVATIKFYDDDSEISLLLPAAISLAAFMVIKLVYAEEDSHPIVFVICSMVAGLLYRSQLLANRGAAAVGPAKSSRQIS